MAFALGRRRGIYIAITEEEKPLSPEQLSLFEAYDLIYRSLCALLFNYVPTSGHPGGSISSGRIVAGILYDAMDYDFSNPDRKEADIISYAAGHKALGLYAMWALRNEAIRIGAPELLPRERRLQLRMEDLLGFRRNPATETPLFKKYRSKPLDGHPTPATPFLRLATGASGVGVASSLGLAYAAKDYYADKAPRVHVVEGEGGLTPGRVAEALTAAGTASLENALLHIDWNQASIDSNHVCRDNGKPGDYVQWNPMELAYFHDWNVVYVPDGKNFQQVIAGQRKAMEIENGQPTAIVYRTTKGWQYGIEGKAAHGAGHKLCTDGFFEAVAPLMDHAEGILPRCEAGSQRCDGGASKETVEECFWEALTILRNTLRKNQTLVEELVRRIVASRARLDKAGRAPRENAPQIEGLYAAVDGKATSIPDELTLTPGTQATLRAQLGKALKYLNEQSRGSVFAAAADLLGSTSINTAGEGFAEGYYNAKTNPEARLLSIGGICEDAMSGTSPVFLPMVTMSVPAPPMGRSLLRSGTSRHVSTPSAAKRDARFPVSPTNPSCSFVLTRASRLARMGRLMPIRSLCSSCRGIFPSARSLHSHLGTRRTSGPFLRPRSRSVPPSWLPSSLVPTRRSWTVKHLVWLRRPTALPAYTPCAVRTEKARALLCSREAA